MGCRKAERSTSFNERSLCAACQTKFRKTSGSMSASSIMGEILHVEDLVAEASYEFDEDPSVGVVSVLAPESAPQPTEEESSQEIAGFERSAAAKWASPAISPRGALLI